MATLAVDYAYLRERIGHALAYRRTAGAWETDQEADINNALEDGLRTFYGHHDWSFLHPMANPPLVTVAPYSTGTITIVNGVVTLAGGTWPSWAAAGELKEQAGGNTYTVNTRDGDLQITLDDTTVNVAAGTSYWLARFAYDLPADFAAFESPLTYQPGVSTYYPAVYVVPESQLRICRQTHDWTDRPVKAALRVKAHDATVGTRWEICLGPLANAVYRLDYRYRINPALITSVNKYPPGAEFHGQTILACCLAAAESIGDDQEGIWTKKLPKLLAESVTRDQEATASDFLGYNGDPSDAPSGDCGRIAHPGGIHTYEGITYYDR